MRALHPDPEPDPDLDRRYAWPPGASWVRVVMVCSLDGAVEGGGRSGGVATAADRRVFARLRRSADVVLVGAGTARAEDYRGIRAEPGRRPPPIAVVTRGAALDPGSRLFTDTRTPPIVLTGPTAPEGRVLALRSAGADVAVLDGTEPASVLGELARRGLRRVLCEGGPELLGALLAADAVDELCLTLAPVLVAGRAGRIATGPLPTTRPMALAGVLEEEGTLLVRYVRTAERRQSHPRTGDHA